MGWTSRIRFLVGAGNFSLFHHIQTRYGANPASYPMGTRCSFARGCEADNSSAKVKNACSYNFPPPYTFMVWYLGTRTTLPLPYSYTKFQENTSSVTSVVFTSDVCTTTVFILLIIINSKA
jgi:hypothetical protein